MHLLDLTRRRSAAGADGPHRLIGDHGVGTAEAAGSEPASCSETTSSVRPDSRCSRVSPMQMMAESPARRAASALARTTASVSCRVRRSGMADNHRRASGVLEHLGGNVAGEGAGGRGMTVLPSTLIRSRRAAAQPGG